MHVYNLFIKPEKLLDVFKKIGFQKKELVGLLPVLSPKSLYHILINGEVHENFSFKITQSTLIGYLGYEILAVLYCTRYSR